jgi:hypothetical protein
MFLFCAGLRPVETFLRAGIEIENAANLKQVSQYELD